MCGFAGIVNPRGSPVGRERLGAMLEAIAHRGPDGRGISRRPGCELAHARLAILDVPGGDQPMHAPADRAKADRAGPLHLVFNGEIYNHRELRRDLRGRGHRFTSDHCDTEVLLHGYRQWGEHLPRHLRGMFAFAIWDEDQRSLYLCRDRAGQKPLYLDQSGEAIMFASLVAALVAGRPPGAGPAVDPRAMLSFLRLGYPMGRSMIRGITELPPAHWMRVDGSGRARAQRYWRPPPVSRSSTKVGAAAAVTEVLGEAVDQRLEADVPLGCFLSGGIDSSLIAALAQRGLKRRGGGALRTFSVAMPDAAYDESAHARAVADHIGARHTVLRADPSDMIADLTRLMAVSGEPTADSSLLPTYWLCRAAAGHVKVALAGDGGDELFGGYDRYRALRLLGRYRRATAAAPAPLLRRANPRSKRHRLGRLIDAARAGPDPAAQYARMIQLFTEDQITELGIPGLDEAADEIAGEATGEAAGAGVAPVPHWPGPPEAMDRVHAAMRWDFDHYLPFDLLRKVDRASMAVPVEVRCPMLAAEVCDLVGHLSTRVLMPGHRPKGLLRAAAAKMLPGAIVGRPKMGFAVPIGQWFREDARDALADHLMGGALQRLGVNRRAPRRYFEEHTRGKADHTHRLFALLQLALWARWLDHPAPAPPLAQSPPRSKTDSIPRHSSG